MIIGISAKIGAGKDTVGRIIQYLMLTESTTKYFGEDWLNKEHHLLDKHSGWQIKKFAGKLKEIVALLTGCTVQDLESQEFKMKELGPEWDQSTQYNGKECHECGTYGNTYVMSDKPTYRELLQVVGTDALRNVVHANVWVNALMADYHLRQKPPQITEKGAIFSFDSVYPNWIITDMRFPNEMEAVKERGGITIRINRDNGTRPIDLNPHASETALDYHDFDYVIDNDGSISDLIDKVREILIKEKLIS